MFKSRNSHSAIMGQRSAPVARFDLSPIMGGVAFVIIAAFVAFSGF